MEKKNKSIKRKLRFWAGVWFAQILLFYIFSKISSAVCLFESFYEWKKDFFGFVFSKLGFSAGDVLYFMLGLGLLFSLVKIFQKKSRKKYTLKLLISWNVFYFVYQCFWGMLYFQQPIISKLSEKPPTEEEIKSLAVKYLNRCLHSRNRVKEGRQRSIYDREHQGNRAGNSLPAEAYPSIFKLQKACGNQ